MRGLIIVALAVVLAGGILRAQTGGLPPGDYQQTCRDIRSNNYRLDATCQRNDGSWTNTWFDYRSCSGSVVNDDGNLRCVGGTPPGSVPSGTYQETCRDMRVDADTLIATCQKRDGTWRNTSLRHYNDCRGQIENDDGNLRCR